MKTVYIDLPQGKRLVWYLAAEEYFAKHLAEVSLDGEGVLFTWKVAPTVIFGRHQVMQNEVNVPFCHEHGIAMYRRKSGGGCVYADTGNLMISYISASTHSEQVFQFYLDEMSALLREMGYPAVKSTHNDILVAGSKVSGNACFALPTGTIVHGTMLFDVDFEMLQQAITPSREKLAKHGVESVRQRVCNLKELGEKGAFRTLEEFERVLVDACSQRRYTLTEQDWQAINGIEEEYLDPGFIGSR